MPTRRLRECFAIQQGVRSFLRECANQGCRPAAPAGIGSYRRRALINSRVLIERSGVGSPSRSQVTSDAAIGQCGERASLHPAAASRTRPRP
jgi:hypothetical protein